MWNNGLGGWIQHGEPFVCVCVCYAIYLYNPFPCGAWLLSFRFAFEYGADCARAEQRNWLVLLFCFSAVTPFPFFRIEAVRSENAILKKKIQGMATVPKSKLY